MELSAGPPREPRRPVAPRHSFHPFLEELLRKMAPTATLRAVLDAPPDHYTLEIRVPGRPSLSLIVNRGMLESAETNPAALRALRGMLTAQLGLAGPANVMRGYRGTRIPPDTPCTVCGLPIREGERPAVKRARIMHARCVPP
jgi:hypothetical protein